VELADAHRNEPLHEFVERPDEESSQRGEDEYGWILERTPRPVEQKGQESVLDEVKPLDGIDFRIARPNRDGVRHTEDHRRHGAAGPSPIADANERGPHRRHHRHDDDRGDDRRELTGEGRSDPGARLADKRPREPRRAAIAASTNGPRRR
jgi:hypothetical protein